MIKNPWDTLFDAILNDNNSYFHNNENELKFNNIYFAGIGKSFYTQVLPNLSCDIAFSSSSFHWLDTHPPISESFPNPYKPYYNVM